MDRTLLLFVEALRQAGVRIAPDETTDAMRITGEIGLDDRDTLRETLGCVLAKSVPDKQRFEATFQRFFAIAQPPAQLPAKLPAKLPDNAAGEEVPPAAASADESTAQPSEPADGLLVQNPTVMQQRLATAARQVRLDTISLPTQKGLYTRRLAMAAGGEELEAAWQQAQRQGDFDAAARLAAQGERLREQARAMVEQAYQLYGKGRMQALSDALLQEKPLSALESRDLKRMRPLVEAMAQRLKDKRRINRKVRRGTLDARRTLRANMGHDGVLLEVAWRRRLKQQPRLVALCDVSRSVARYVRFLLMLLFELKAVIRDLQVFAFAGDAACVNELFQRLSLEQALDAVPYAAPGGSTDYGQLWRHMMAHQRHLLTSQTTVLVLGDARSNDLDPEVALLRRLASQVKRVIWLDPEPRVQWGWGDSVIWRYRPMLHGLHECSTLLQLEHAVNRALVDFGA